MKNDEKIWGWLAWKDDLEELIVLKWAGDKLDLWPLRKEWRTMDRSYIEMAFSSVLRVTV